ncbi:HIT family protein [Polycladidibacter hongkongensis]|uniref:HIT family protein n=1 Tax=Polycladidibacter hongkongensis TaxID=1647556 RepID=UPI000833CDC0|nr:HIT family protein [Pseudovibrio hongkongensis]
MTSTNYDPQNIFAKILRGELPCEKLYEDEHTIAIMDIMPRAPGHLLVIPKAPSRNLLDIDEDALCAAIKTARKLAIATKAAFAADGVTMQQFSEPAGGQVVFHTHIHVIPRMDDVPLGPHGGPMADATELKAHADKIRAAL